MNNQKKNAIIVSLTDDVIEIKQLAESLDYYIVETFIQHKKTPDVNSYIGSGKVKEIKEFIENYDNDIDLIIVDGKLKPSQWFILEKKLNVNVYDRLRLILAIFRDRADRKEAELQVRLAELQYEKPFVRELIHRVRGGEHPGLMAGGEYQVDDYFEIIKKQTKKIRKDLDKIRDERQIHRKHRHTGGFFLVSIAGYTNAGKSSLLNLLSGEKVKVEKRLFSTLSTTTRRMSKKNVPILLTDTVGFIDNLPAWIINAFHSTLEELEASDVVLLVVDCSDNEELFGRKLKTAMSELINLDVVSPVIIVLNKIDLISEDELLSKFKYLDSLGFLVDHKVVSISVSDRTNIDDLLVIVFESLPDISCFTVYLPNNKETQSFISWLYKKAFVSSISYDEYVKLDIKCNSFIFDKISSMCYKLNGKLIK
jgi:GTP-binding protein HflX